MVARVKAFTSTDTGYPDKTIITTGDAFEQMYQFMLASPVVVFDFETSGLTWFKHACACGIAFGGFDPNNGRMHYYYVPFRHHTGEEQLQFQAIAPYVNHLLGDENKLKIAHNIKFDEHMARREGWQVRGPRYDTMIAAHLYDENRRIALKLRAVSDLGREEAPYFESLMDLEVEKLAKLNGMPRTEYRALYGYSEIGIQMCGTYACFDVEYTLLLYLFYERWGLSQRYSRIWLTEMQLTHVLCDMERNGLPIDVGYLVNLRSQLEVAKDDFTFEIEHRLGHKLGDFNLASDDDMRDFLINKCRLQLTKTTKKGKLAVDKDVLESFSDVFPVLTHMQKWREIEKLLNTYTTSILKRLDANNVLHPDYQQVGASSGRTSCQQPNFQNQPNDSDTRSQEHCGLSLEDGGIDPWSIRRAYVTRGPGWVRLFFDYSQIELRVVAHYSQDRVMVKAFLDREDIHNRTSIEVFNSKEKVYRRKAKVINFGLCCLAGQRVLTKQDGLVPIELVKAHHLLWDGVEWVAHEGLVCRGRKEVVEYDGIKATPNHEVYTESGRKVPIIEMVLGRRKEKLAIGACGDVPVEFSTDGECSTSQIRKENAMADRVFMPALPKKALGVCREYFQGFFEKMRLSAGKIFRCEGENFRGTLRRDGTAVQSGYPRFLAQLQRAWGKGVVRVTRTLCSVGVGDVPRFGFQGVGFRQDGQRGGLLSGEFEACGSQYQFVKSSSTWGDCLQGGAFAGGGQFIHKSQRASGLQNLHEALSKGVPGKAKTEKGLVYDLVNAGPRNRFTIEGKIVSNSYGLTPIGFSRQIGVPVEEAEKYFNTFFSRYKGITQFKKDFRAQVYKDNGYFENLFGRPKRIPNVRSFVPKDKNRAERQEIAVLIQGTAAELTKESLVRIHNSFEKLGLKALLVATVHDEIQIDCPVEELTRVVPLVKGLMEDFREFEPIPIIVDAEYTVDSWADKKGLPND